MRLHKRADNVFKKRLLINSETIKSMLLSVCCINLMTTFGIFISTEKSNGKGMHLRKYV